MKETSNSLEDLTVHLPEAIVVWHTMKNLLKEYNIMKQMILEGKLPSFSKLEMSLLSKEMS